MNPPSVLLDRSFLEALANADDINHDDAVETYRELVEDFVAQRCLIVARADHLEAVTTSPQVADLFAAIDKLHVARQHRNAAADVVARTGMDIDTATTMVLIHRGRIRRVLTFDEAMSALVSS